MKLRFCIYGIYERLIPWIRSYKLSCDSDLRTDGFGQSFYYLDKERGSAYG